MDSPALEILKRVEARVERIEVTQEKIAERVRRVELRWATLAGLGSAVGAAGGYLMGMLKGGH